MFSGIPVAHTLQPIDWKRNLLPPLSKCYQDSSFPQNTLKIYKYCYYICDCFHEITRLFLSILSSSIKLTKWLIFWYVQWMLLVKSVFFFLHIINLICVITWFNKRVILCSTWCLKMFCLHFESAKKIMMRLSSSIEWNIHMFYILMARKLRKNMS